MCCLSQTTAHYHLKWAIIIVGSSKWVLSLVGALTAIFVVFVSVLHLLLDRWVDEKKNNSDCWYWWGSGETLVSLCVQRWLFTNTWQRQSRVRRQWVCYHLQNEYFFEFLYSFAVLAALYVIRSNPDARSLASFLYRSLWVWHYYKILRGEIVRNGVAQITS